MSDNSPSPAAPDWDAPITLQDAAALSGLAYNTLRALAHTGRLQTVQVGARLHTTTRRWLDDYLRTRGTPGGRGKPPKPLPVDYQAPPRRGRPRKARGTGTQVTNTLGEPASALPTQSPHDKEGL